jgi:hypothetical protein
VYIHKNSENSLYYVAHLTSFYPEDYSKNKYVGGDEFIRTLPYKLKIDMVFSRLVHENRAKLCLTKQEAYEEATLMMAERGFMVEHGILEI